ncbi:uncharacterized protein At4g26485-like [Aristolochia californica]|uniref:uncharacterized protein At4g26485-like n=1 Tax=Aristolochia californica TaxID=171875 RepID=UPI0035DA729B
MEDIEEEISSFSLEDPIRKEKLMNYYSSSHRILLVGEGNFSFALSLGIAFGSAANMVATSLDTQESLDSKYSCAIGNVRELEEMGCLVLHGVDATKMSDHFFLRTQRFDRIVYNFPHVGFLHKEGNCLQIEMNKRLMKGFFKNARALLKRRGEVHVTHKIGETYDKWNIVKKAEKMGLVLKEKREFCPEDYPGYENKRAHGRSPDQPFNIGDCRTFVFRVQST